MECHEKKMKIEICQKKYGQIMILKRKKGTKVSPMQSYLRTVIYECDFV